MAVVMVVDDTDSARDSVVRLLRLAGHSAVPARNGREALDFLEHTRPDLMLLDISMPGLDGLSVLEALRTHPRWR
ncbi:MAG: response regulator, partial [Tepidisphaeraceae bacterium]